MEDYFPDVSAISNKKNEDPYSHGRHALGNAAKKICVSLEPRKKPPCARPRFPSSPRRTCPAMGPEPPEDPTPCTAEEPRVVKPLKKASNAKSERCQPARVVRGPCGTSLQEGASIGGLPAKIFALEKTLSKSQWQDEEGYHSASVTMSQIYRPDDEFGPPVKSCGSEKRRNYLRAKLRELMGESRPIPEGGFPEGGEAKPEPEVVAAALLMSEGESNDLGKARPDNIFHQLFSGSTPDRAVALASACPEPMNSVVVPLTVQGQKPASLDLPNPEKMVQRARGVAAPNPSVFQESDVFSDFSEHLQADIEGRSPQVADVSGYVGAYLGPNKDRDGSNVPRDDLEEGMIDYVIRPEPPSYRNRVRLNGSVRPSWFPGYAVVSPLIPDCVRLSQNPGDALSDAWCLCRPRHFDDLSKSLVNTG